MSKVKPKFTPGPWHLCAHLKDINEEVGCSCGYRGVIYGPEPVGYAICQPGHEVYPGEEDLTPPRYDRMTEIANAHLISASPDLFECVSILVNYIPLNVVECRGDKCREPWCASCNGWDDAEKHMEKVMEDRKKALSAINKALGKVEP